MVTAHPLTEHGVLPGSPVLGAALAVCAVVAIGLGRPGERPSPDNSAGRPSWAGPLEGPALVTRAASLLVLWVAVIAGRFGTDDQLDNLAPALVVGVAWPLLVAGGALLGSVWRWIDPWDTMARAASESESEDPPATVWPASLSAFAWVWFLSAYSSPLAPRSVATALGLYSLVTVGGCLVVGRVSWLGRAEWLGLYLTWVARIRWHGLTSWRPRPGTGAVLGVLGGGLLFGALRASELWGTLNVDRNASWYALGGVTVAAGLGAALIAGCERWAGDRGTVSAAAVPVTAALGIALALANNRLFTSLQLLPGLLGDPFGWGWNLLGEAAVGIRPAPLGVTGLALTQVAVMAAGIVVGARTVARRSGEGGRAPALVSLAILAALGTLAVTSNA